MDIRTIVVDNTVELKEKLTKLLNEIPGVTVCQSFDDAVAAMQYVEEHPVDLVFSDVVMPEISGITLASSIYALPVRLHHKALHPPSDRRHDQKIPGALLISDAPGIFHFPLLTVRKSPCNPGLLPLSSAHHLTQPRLK